MVDDGLRYRHCVCAKLSAEIKFALGSLGRNADTSTLAPLALQQPVNGAQLPNKRSSPRL
jgi:hypothetical protein